MRFYDPTEHSAYELECNRAGDPRHRRGAFGPSFSDSKTTDSRVAATEDAQVAQGGGVSAKDTAVAATNRGQAQRGRGNTQVSVGDKSSLTVKGIDVSGAKGPVTVTTADPQVVTAALTTVKELAAGGAELVAQSTQQNNELLAKLAESKQTGGQSEVNKSNTTIAVVGMLMVAGTLYFLNRKKA